MDEFLSRLDINENADLDELTKQFALVLSFLQIDPILKLDANEIRAFLRAALFLHGNLEIHGYNLEQKLKQCDEIPTNELNTTLSKFRNGSLLDDVCIRLLTTSTGPEHILEVQTFCSDFLDSSRYSEILQKAEETRSGLIIDEIAVEAKFLLNTTFQLLSTTDIETAIKRIVQTVSFDILAWIINFNETHTYLFMKCFLIQNEIFSDLENGQISTNFIASMYEISCQDDNGLSTYLKCLHNKFFAKSLMTFFISYLTAIADENEKTDKLDIRKHDLLHVSFLIAAMLSNKSDYRIEFQKRLASISVNTNVLLSISHLNFVYNF